MVSASLEGVVFAAAPQAINVDFDATFLVQLVLFVALTLVLKPLLFDPIMKVFEEREKLIDGAKAEARRMDEKSGGALSLYDAEMTKARAAGNLERERARSEGLRREQEVLAKVREAAARALEAGKRAAHAEAERVREELKADAGGLANDLASRVLGRQVNS